MPEINIAVLAPELLLSIGAMAILMLGAFGATGKPQADGAGWLSIGVLVAAGIAVCLQDAQTATVFDDAFILDGFARFLKLLILAGSAVSILLSFDYLRRANVSQFEIPVLVLLATAGMLMMVSANDLIALYLGLELQSLSLYVLAAVRRDDARSSEAGMKYFVLGALSSGILLYGASLLYGFTGGTSFAVIANAAGAAGASTDLGLVFGLVLVLVGLAFKVSAVPFHMWTPDVYEGAPTPITAFFASAPKLAAMGIFARVLIDAFPGLAEQWQQILTFLAIASMGLGAFAAIGQDNIKRLLAYSSIGHVGFALVGLAAATEQGVEGLLVYLAIYLVMTLGAFACVIAMRTNDGPVEKISDLSGLANRNLSMAFVFGMLLFSLAGVPPLAGFFAKWYVFAAAVKAGLYPLAIIGVLASVIGAYYYLRVVKIMFFDDEAEAKLVDVEIYTKAVMFASAAFVLIYWVYPSPLVDAANAAAKTLQF